MTIKVVSPDELDLQAYAHMQRQSFAELLQQSGVSDEFISPKYYQWKYRPPAGNARIALVFDEGEMVASNAMFPLKIAVGERELQGWQSCDTATVPKARGKGYFMKCLKVLEAELKPGEIFFGFPNKNSKRGFEKLGWRETQTVPAFVKIIPFLWGRENAGEDIGFDLVNGTFDPPETATVRPTLVRNAAYLRWRYEEHPTCKYSIYAHRMNHALDGYVVIREAEIMGRRAVLLMELHASSQAVERALLMKAKHCGVKRGIHYVVMVSNYFTGWSGLLKGFILIPSRFLPKQQVLMGSGTTPETHEVMGEQWLVQLGDWDGF